MKGKSCCQILSKKNSQETKSNIEIKASVSSKEPQRGFAKECRRGVKLDLRFFKKKKKSQRKPDLIRLVIPALGRPRQDDRTFVPVGLIPSKYHRKKGEDRKQCPAGRRPHPLDASPWRWSYGGGATVKFPTGLETRQAFPKSSAASARLSSVSGHTILTVQVRLRQ